MIAVMVAIGDRFEFDTRFGPLTAKSYYIYALCDPRDDVIRYVGVTTHPLQRLHAHISVALEERRNAQGWIRALVIKGLYPYLQVLDRCDEKRRAYRKEHTYIKQYCATVCNAGWHGPDRARLQQQLQQQRETVNARRPQLLPPPGWCTIRMAATELRLSRQRVHQLLHQLRIRSRHDRGIGLLSPHQMDQLRHRPQRIGRPKTPTNRA